MKRFWVFADGLGTYYVYDAKVDYAVAGGLDWDAAFHTRNLLEDGFVSVQYTPGASKPDGMSGLERMAQEDMGDVCKATLGSPVASQPMGLSNLFTPEDRIRARALGVAL